MGLMVHKNQQCPVRILQSFLRKPPVGISFQVLQPQDTPASLRPHNGGSCCAGKAQKRPDAEATRLCGAAVIMKCDFGAVPRSSKQMLAELEKRSPRAVFSEMIAKF